MSKQKKVLRDLLLTTGLTGFTLGLLVFTLWQLFISIEALDSYEVNG